MRNYATIIKQRREERATNDNNDCVPEAWPLKVMQQIIANRCFACRIKKRMFKTLRTSQNLMRFATTCSHGSEGNQETSGRDLDGRKLVFAWSQTVRTNCVPEPEPAEGNSKVDENLNVETSVLKS